MKKTLIAAAIAALLSTQSSAFVRQRTLDVAFPFRMGAGFPGDVNRTHPASILPRQQQVANPVRLYGDPVLVDTATNSVRAFIAGDTAVTRLYGAAVRPYPTQQATGGMSSALGAAAVPAGPLDILREGYMIARCNNFATAQPTLDGPVFVWCAASAGVHVQGGFESVATGGSTAAIANARWCGPTDANGITEIEILPT